MLSFQEKSTWVMGVVVLGVYGWYFVTVLRMAGDVAVAGIAYQTIMFLTVVALVVLAVIGHVVIAIVDPKGSDQTDERDRTINRYGEYIGGYVLAVGALVALALAMIEVEYFWIANTILAGLVLAELTTAATRIVLYRRGF